MPQLKINDQTWDASESSQYQNASDIEQEITIGTSDTAVTLDNPHIVELADATSATIYIKLANMSSFVSRHFAAGQEKVLRAATIGGSVTGTTATTVIVRGIK